MASLIGRADELLAITASVEAGVRLTCVHGPPGVGKTQLVTCWATQRRLTVVSVAGAVGADDVRSAVAAALGISAEPEVVQRVVEGSGDPLVLDECEDALEAVEACLAAWATQAVITTRDLLETAGSRSIRLGPLPVEDAVELLRARAMERGIQVAASAPLHALAEAVDRLPLALVLAGGQLDLYTPEELLETVDTLLGSRSGRLALQLEKSWARLAPTQRELLAAACCWEGAFTRAHLRAAGVDANALGTLLDRALIQPLGGQPRRFRVLAVIRAWVRTVRQDDVAALRQATTVAILTDGEALAAKAYGSEGRRSLASLRYLRAELTAIAHRADDGHAVRALHVLSTLHAIEGPVEEWHQQVIAAVSTRSLPPQDAALLVGSAANALRLAIRFDEALALLQSHVPWNEIDGETRAVLEAELGAAQCNLGHYEEGLPRLRSFLEAYPAISRESAVFSALLSRALVHHGETEEGEEWTRRALQIALAADQQDMVAHQYHRLSLICRDPIETVELLRQCVAAQGLAGGTRQESLLLAFLGSVLADIGETSAAVDTLAKARRIARGGGHSWSLAVAVSHTATVLCAVGRAADAVDRVDEALALGWFTRTALATLRGSRGVALLFAGRPQEAILELEAALDLFDRHQLPRLRLAFGPFLVVLKPDQVDAILPAALKPSTESQILREIAVTANGAGIPDDVVARARDWSHITRAFLELAPTLVERPAVALDGSWLRGPGGARVALAHRKVLQRVLRVLVEARDGEPLTMEEFLAAAWPGEATAGRSGHARVYVAVSTLRKLGLGSALETVSGPPLGYRLAPSVEVHTP